MGKAILLVAPCAVSVCSGLLGLFASAALGLRLLPHPFRLESRRGFRLRARKAFGLGARLRFLPRGLEHGLLHRGFLAYTLGGLDLAPAGVLPDALHGRDTGSLGARVCGNRVCQCAGHRLALRAQAGQLVAHRGDLGRLVLVGNEVRVRRCLDYRSADGLLRHGRLDVRWRICRDDSRRVGHASG